MERVIVLKDLAYGGGVTALAECADDLVDGEIGIYGASNGVLLGAAQDSDYVDQKEFVIAYNQAGTVFLSKPINRQGIKRFDKGDYVAPVFHKVQAGGTTALLAFGFLDTDIGDVSIRVADNTFSSMYATNMNNASVFKKASQTVENVVDALVVILNASTMLPVTAAKIGAAGDWGITIESKLRGQILSLTGEGLLQGMNRDVDGTNASVLPVNGDGVSEDVLQHEKDSSMYRGSANSRELESGYYSQQFATVDGEVYKTIVFNETLSKPYHGETNVSPLYTIYLPNGATTLNTALLAVFQRLIEGAYTTATASEEGDA